MELELKLIRMDGGTQSRAEIHHEVVDDYASAMDGGSAFPLPVVFFDGTHYWLADGFHRVRAALKLGRTSLPVEVRKGSQRDAVLFSVGANTAHGLRRTNEDKQRAVKVMLDDPEWSTWSDRAIADTVGVGATMVGRMRKQLSDALLEQLEAQPVALPARRIGLDGKERPASPRLLQSDAPAAPVGESRSLLKLSSARTAEQTKVALKVVRTGVLEVRNGLLGIVRAWEKVGEELEKENSLWAISSDIFREVERLMPTLSRSAAALDAKLPHSICPTCGGENSVECVTCRKTGWITKAAADHLSSKQT